jgi:glutamate-1-semialdehyde 2,1-aminomutase
VMGGLHLHYGVEPDMAIFGKTLGNGYAINAVIGRESVMQSAEATFISSTFWTERIGSTAGLAALDAMEEEDAPRRIDEIGLRVRDGWRQACDGLGLGVSFSGLPALSVMSVEGVDPATLRTFLTEQMLASGYLAGPAVYASIAHSDEVLETYLEVLNRALTGLAGQANGAGTLNDEPLGRPVAGFARLA